ncbi:hypothetical protein EDC01DRAFT_636251 [Geopyxis carbonaria]|nr:hypothetical protein EDC01DRAFT_636251 [Geopyxis carbonaria]
MSQVTITDTSLASLRGKNVLLTGGSTGIGAATIALLHSLDCTITFGDINTAAGSAVASQYPSDKVQFVQCDVTSYASQLTVFKAALSHGPLHAVFANAGITSSVSFITPSIPGEDPSEPALPDLDVNLRGAIYTAHLALHYFRQNPGLDAALVFTASAASYLDTPPIHIYTAAKHGVLGLMRSLRAPAAEDWGVRVNVVAPWFTKTPMAATLGPKWGDRPANTPEGVARALVYAAVSEGGNGNAYWVGGDEVVEMEKAIRGRRDVWLGEKMAQEVNGGQKALGGW